MRNFRSYLIVGLITFSIGIIASRFLISSQVKGDCIKNLTITIVNGKNSKSSDVIIKSSNSNFSVTITGVKDTELSKVMMIITSEGKSLPPCQIINESSL
jgi:hypothetical protein